MTHPSKRKGAGFELEVLRRLQACGLVVEKMPLSGALPNYSGDIAASIRGAIRKLECKRRGRAFGTLYSLMGQSYALVIRDDHTDPLVVLRLDDFAELAKNS
jgi:Holliday junction resolvase